jgi:hypothetical protein
MALLVVLLVGARGDVAGESGASYFLNGNELKAGLDTWNRGMRSPESLSFLSYEDRLSGTMAIGYVTGIYDFLQERRLSCGPQEVTRQQIADMVSTFLADHPDKRHFGAAGLTWITLDQAFPCAKGKAP